MQSSTSIQTLESPNFSAFHTPKKEKMSDKMAGTPSTQNQSPENIRANSFQLLGQNSPWSQNLKSNQSSREQITDRYIPARKLFSQESLSLHSINTDQMDIERQDEGIENIGPIPVQDDEISSTRQYRQYLLKNYSNSHFGNLNNDRQQPLIFHNSNLLRYSECTKEKEGIQSWINGKSLLQVKGGQENSKYKVTNKVPYKVLDAPSIRDDYYLNLLEWSEYCNVIAVALDNKVYQWHAEKQTVNKIAQYTDDKVSSVSFSKNAPYLAIGTEIGKMRIYDLEKQKLVREYSNHNEKIGCISWSNNFFLTSGSKDKSIVSCDIRQNNQFCFRKYLAHKQEVCGIKWSNDGQKLASGGNDNRLLVWDIKEMDSPMLKFLDHKAAVKALAWSPHQHGLLISGGGTADKTIRFRNSATGQTSKIIDTGSQVCNLMFSKTVKNHFVSTHGFSDNEICIWKYPRIEKVCSLKNHHTSRVLYLSMSPDGSSIVTGAGDQTLRFWKLFPSESEVFKDKNQNKNSLLQVKHVSIR